MKLQYLKSSILEIPEDYNFYLTASAYNFSWFFNGKKLKIPLRYEKDCISIAIVEQIEDKKLKVDYYSTSRDVNIQELEDRLIYYLGINEDLSEFYNLCKNDPLLKEVPIGLHMRSCDPWTAFLIAISQQNASFRQGWYMLYRLYKYYGKQVLVGNEIVILLPKPEDLIRHGEKVLKDCGYGYRSSIVIEVAKKIIESKDQDTRRLLKGIKGIGPYTYGLSCVIAYRMYELPVIDRWVKGLYESIGIKDVDKYLKSAFGKWQGLVTWFLTIVLDAEPLSKAIERVKRNEIKPKMTGLTPLTIWKIW